MGREQDIPNLGDCFVKDVAVLNTSLIVVRGNHGVVRAFHNMCRHRGNQVVKMCSGNTTGFQCGFHGWTYDTKGQLAYVPEEELFPNFDKRKYALTPAATDT